MEFKTVNDLAKSDGISANYLRQLIKRHECPGFYSGTRFYINVPMLREMLEQQSRASMTGCGSAM